MKYICLVLMMAVMAGHAQTTDWRFGFEYNELPPPLTSETLHDTLLSRLQYVTSSQPGGAINVNGGGWNAMQPSEFSVVNFTESDGWVSRFQDAGYELIFYLTPNTAWSQVANFICADGPGPDECAPDADHWDDWTDYVKQVVERYDGDGLNDMPSLLIPVRFYVLPQEVSFSGQGQGDDDDENGVGFWDDNQTHLVEVHRKTYEALQEADPTGNSKLVGSGGWYLDLYADFPDYPQVEGPTVQGRLNGANLFGSTYQKGFDSLKTLLTALNDTSGGKKCDYIGWHPHSGWKSTDQSFRFVKTYAPDLPIYIDDMWSAMLTAWDGLFFVYKDGYCQFIGGDSVEGDFPTGAIASYADLFNGLEAGDDSVTNWYNAKTAREAVKCFVTAFGEGAERVHFSMSNDLNPDAIFLYPFSQPYRFTGMVERKDSGYVPKPVMYTMKLLVDQLFDFTGVFKLDGFANPLTRVYRFERERGTDCYVAWSEAGWNTETPEIANGETVSFPVVSDTLTKYDIVSSPGQTAPVAADVFPLNDLLTVKLGFQPVLIEEKKSVTGYSVPVSSPEIQVFPNPCSSGTRLIIREAAAARMELRILDATGRVLMRQTVAINRSEFSSIDIPVSGWPAGLYSVHITDGSGTMITRFVVGH